MPGMSLQDYQAYVWLDRQVQQLELAQGRRSGTMENSDRSRFLLSPTCPPSTSLRFQGGLLWRPVYVLVSNGFLVPSYTVDLSDTDKVYGEFKFTNPYWYMPCLILISQYLWPPPDPWPSTAPDDTLRFFLGDECETTAEAEDAAWLLRAHTAAYYGFVAGAVILRNNGNVLDYNQFMVIDPINRGRSYIFDYRQRYGWELA